MLYDVEYNIQIKIRVKKEMDFLESFFFCYNLESVLKQ